MKWFKQSQVKRYNQKRNSLINIETVWSNEKLSSLDERRNCSVKQCYGLVYRGVWHHEDKIWRQASRPCQTAFQNSCKLKPGFTSSFFFPEIFSKCVEFIFSKHLNNCFPYNGILSSTSTTGFHRFRSILKGVVVENSYRPKGWIYREKRSNRLYSRLHYLMTSYFSFTLNSIRTSIRMGNIVELWPA